MKQTRIQNLGDKKKLINSIWSKPVKLPIKVRPIKIRKAGL